jgi:hypothetical protein
MQTFKRNAQETANKVEEVFYKCVLELNFASIFGSGLLIFSKKVKIAVAYCSDSHFCSIGTFCCLFGRRLKSPTMFFTVAWFFKILSSKLLHLPPSVSLRCQRMLESGLLKRNRTQLPQMLNPPNRKKTNFML